jgi:hypothetical protein
MADKASESASTPSLKATWSFHVSLPVKTIRAQWRNSARIADELRPARHNFHEFTQVYARNSENSVVHGPAEETMSNAEI